jgi:hydrogenase maturation protease
MTIDERPITRPASKQASRLSPTLIIGLGNPILGDDGVGWKVAEIVQELISSDPRFQMSVEPVDSKIVHAQNPVEIDCLSLGGLSLMERMLGYERVIVVDSMKTGQCPQGSVSVYALEELPNPSAGHSASAHDTSLITALRTAKAVGADIPSRVDIVAIEIKNMYDFSEELTPLVAQASLIATQTVLDLLTKEEL